MTKPNDKEWAEVEHTQMFEPPCTSIVTSTKEDGSKRTRLVVMSDTHGHHRSVRLPSGDVLIHAGDFTQTGKLKTIQDLALYFDSLNDDYGDIVCIAGNHDLTLDRAYYDEHWERFHSKKEDGNACRSAITKCAATLLEDSALIVKGDLFVYGSPWTPHYFNWAFNFPPGASSVPRSKWREIPDATDILITHGPPLGRGDLAITGRAGCRDLLEEVQQRVRPQVHIFGHIHEGRGVSSDGTTLFVNGSNLDLRYRPTNPCFVIDVPHDRTKPAVVVQPDCQLNSAESLKEWLAEHGYVAIAAALEDSPGQVPLGNDLLHADALQALTTLMRIDKDRTAKADLRQALAELYAGSF